jgi:uncharacterized heparinase superfamily protein
LTPDGRSLTGEDFLLAVCDKDKQVFDAAMDAVKLQGIAYSVRFHLHPDVNARLDMGGTAVSLALKSGEIWVFRHGENNSANGANLGLEPSVYLERNRLKPRVSKQIVLSARAIDYASRVSWNLSKAHGTPDNLRDLARDEDEFLQSQPNEEPR